MKTWLSRLFIVGCAAAVITAGGASIAQAHQGDYTSSSGVRIRSYPINGTVNGVGYPGQGSYAYWGIDCTNGYVNGNDWWDWNKDLSTGIIGYSSDYYLSEYADNYYYTGTPC